MNQMHLSLNKMNLGPLNKKLSRVQKGLQSNILILPDMHTHHSPTSNSPHQLHIPAVRHLYVKKVSIKPLRLEHTQHKFHTKLATTLGKLFTNNQTVIDLDKAKFACKQQPQSHLLKTKYKELESRVSVMVL